MSGRTRSRFAYLNVDDIQNEINNGTLDAYDIVYTKDTHENLIITPDLSTISVGSRIYRFLDAKSAEEFLNMASDTYEGQIVAVVYNDHYVGYIVNKNSSGLYYVTPLNAYEGEINYDTLTHRPITQLDGLLGEPIILDELNDGIYKITGQYRISNSLETIFSSVSSNLFLIQHYSSETQIKKINTNSITDYNVSDGNVTSSVVPTTEWLKNQGYVTESYVDNKIAALNFITQEEVKDYVSDVVLQTIDSLVDEKIDNAMNERIQLATEKETLDEFVKIFN